MKKVFFFCIVALGISLTAPAIEFLPLLYEHMVKNTKTVKGSDADKQLAFEKMPH